MKTLFFGAGPLGLLYAYRLHESGADITVLARGEKHQLLEAGKLSLVNGYTEERVAPGFKVVNHLKEEDEYDLVVVLVRKNKIASVLEALMPCTKVKNVLFMGNNVLGFDTYFSALPRAKVLFGFPGAGGGWEENAIRYVDSESPGAKRMPVRIGEYDGVERERTREIRKLFENAGVPVEVVADIDGWLKYHAAFVIPICLAIHRHNGDLKAMVADQESLRLIVLAGKECGNVLKALGYTKRQPFKFNLFYWLPERITAKIFRKMLASRYAKVAIAMHAGASRDEFTELTRDFLSLAAQTEVDTSHFNTLAGELEVSPAQSELPADQDTLKHLYHHAGKPNQTGTKYNDRRTP